MVTETKSLSEIWARRQSDRVRVMNLAEKETYDILNSDKNSFETFSSKHGILNIAGKDAETAQWIEWQQPTDRPEQSRERLLH